jgi:hypothetical protein
MERAKNLLAAHFVPSKRNKFERSTQPSMAEEAANIRDRPY